MKFLNFFKGIKGKLFVVMLIPILSTCLTTWIVHAEFDHLGSKLDNVYGVLLPDTDRLGRMNTSRAQLGFYLWAAYGNPQGSKNRQDFIEKTENSLARYQEDQKAYESVEFQTEEAKNYEVVRQEKDDFAKLTKDIVEELKAGHDENVFKMLNESNWRTEMTHIKGALEANVKFFTESAVKLDVEQKHSRQVGMLLLLGLGAVSILIIGTLVGWVSAKLTKSIAETSEVLSGTVKEVSSAIEQLSAAGTTLSTSTSTSASSLQETVASVEELSSTVLHNSENAKQAAELSATSKESAQVGEAEIRNLIESMKDISNSSHKIEDITNVIDDIAFQTNLLALNAAVEAARAGDQGRGFAVVAEAVRSLAQRSSVAAKDISGLIRESVLKIERGVKIADKSGEALGVIVRSVNQVSDLNKEISEASQEQSKGISQISLAMNQLDQSVQTNAASAEEVASTSTEIASQAEKMQIVMERLHAVIFGSQASVSPVVPSAPADSTAPNVVKFSKIPKSEKEKLAEQLIPFEPSNTPPRQIGKIENF
jgi:methyl-accepting chemotaxis protein